MNLSCKQFFSLLSLGAVCAFSASAETVSTELTIDFENYELGTQLGTNGSPSHADIIIAEDPLEGGEQGRVLHVNHPDWNTWARIISISCPKGFTIADCIMIEVSYYNPSETPSPLDIKLKAPVASWPADWTNVIQDEDILSDGWNTAVFAPDSFEYTEQGEANTKASEFGLAVGFFKNPTDYYIGDITFYFEKEMSQRELDEAALDKSTAACVEINFDDLEANPAGTPHLGSNGGSTGRPDMIIDKGPEGYNNNCAHIIYGGHTQIFLWDLIKCPEGYTFDDLRLVEYDIYETEIAGVDHTTGQEFAGKNGAPVLKVKDAPWSIDSNSGGSTCGNSALAKTNEWTHVEFLPSGIAWAPRDFTITEGEGDDAVSTPVHWDADQTRDEMGKKTSFAINIGFFPCLNQCYVDNVKLWFQKGANSGDVSAIEDVVVTPETQGYTVYNLQGICVLRTAEASDINNLPAGLYIINGKKYLVK